MQQKFAQSQEDNNNEDSSEYTAEFFNDKQQQSQKEQQEKSQLLDYFQKQGFLGQKTFREIQESLIKKFGNDLIQKQKSWIIMTLNNKKHSPHQSKIEKGQAKQTTPIKQQNKKQVKKQQQSDSEESNNEENNELVNKDQQQIVPYKFESLSASKQITETEESQSYSDSSFPNLDKIEDLITNKFSQLTSGTMKEMYNRLIEKIPQDLQKNSKAIFEEQINQLKNQIKQVQEKISKINSDNLQDQIQKGEDELTKIFNSFINDIKKISPTLGIATQEQLAGHVRRFSEQQQSLTKNIDETNHKLQQLLERYEIFSDEVIRQLKTRDQKIQDQEKSIKNTTEQLNKVVQDQKKSLMENFETLNQNVKLINQKLITIEKNEQKSKTEQFQNQQPQLNQTPSSQQQQIQQTPNQQFCSTQTDLEQTIKRFNQNRNQVKFINIDKKLLIYDKVQQKLFEVNDFDNL